jgi:SAM-dependent methyltransferase
MTDHTATSYDALPYPSGSYPETHPDRLATLGRLFGLRPAPVEECRVLELGCASGGNLIPMAATLPGSLFIGIDSSQRQIVAGRTIVRELGLDNITLDAMSLLDVPPDAGPFDYILCHGVYSWVPLAVQEGILCVCKQNLAPQGIAYVSYNTLPGWHIRLAVREMLLIHTRGQADPQARLAEGRKFLSFLAGAVPERFGAYRQALKEEEERLRQKADGYVLHDELEEENHPVYFHEFAQRAAAAGLQFLAEADVAAVRAEHFAPHCSRPWSGWAKT